MVSYIAGMCIALPMTLYPQRLLYKLGLISKIKKEKWALATGQFCARWMLRFLPFLKLEAIPHHEKHPQPAIWVCNHASSLDIFVMLAADRVLRGKCKRPIKIVYVSWSHS